MAKAKKKAVKGKIKRAKLKPAGGDGGPFPLRKIAGRRAQSEDDGANPLVKIILAFAAVKPTAKKIAITELPRAVSATFLSWAQSLNLPLDDGSTDSSYYSVTARGLPDTFLASYAGDDPDPFLATAVAQGGAIVGTSVEVED